MKTFKLSLMILPMLVIMSCQKQKTSRDLEKGQKSEREINVTELPSAVTQSINEQYSGAELIEADEITMDNGSFTYDVEIKHNNTKFEVMYDANGNYLGKEADEDKEDEKCKND